MTAGHGLFDGGGATGALMAGLDWADTPVGPVSRWPQSLRAAVRLVLSSRYPMLLLWGDSFSQLYNDAYAELIGDKHPAALGNDVRVTLAEGWDVLAPIIAQAMTTGVASWLPALRLRLVRAGYPEEAYFSVSHAPARDDAGATVGVFAVCSEVTQQVIGERRLRLLRDLALRGGGNLEVRSTCVELMQTIGAHPLDVPFAAVYLRDGDALHRVAEVGVDVAGRGVGAVLPQTAAVDAPAGADPWSLGSAATGRPVTVNEVAGRLTVVAGAWGEPVEQALVLPLPSADPTQPLGVVLAGISPSRALDDAYRSFLDLLGQQISVAVRNARAYEEERQRAQVLAELDRAKTDFFTNVSHELRTPLTLMLGPLDDALDDVDDPLSAGQRDRVDTARRNATRLLRLVNNLLDFTSLQANRATAAPRPVDLAQLTTEVVGVFRAAVERAGLRLVVDCPPLPGPVAVDPEHWETIVTNLLSNALKFTFVGEIRVSLRATPQEVRLTVADTGIGIAGHELTRLFERFHRVRGARSRSHEGTGIGLALVQELVRLTGGDVRVDSEPGSGAAFTVVLPASAVQAPPGAPAADDLGVGRTARTAVQEAIQWLRDEPVEPDAGTGTAAQPGTGGDAAGPGARILVADDNPDMRAYLRRVLTAQGWTVHTVADGQAALEAIRSQPPDLVLTDVMMPRLDGFGLLRELRRDEAGRAVPVVVLSARAGREASVEGLDLGADDYLVKPFSARELVARVRATLRSAGAHGLPLPAAGTGGHLLAAARVVETAVRLLTGQAAALPAVGSAVTELAGPDTTDPVRIAVADPAGPVPDEPAPPLRPGQPTPGQVTVPVPGSAGEVLGALTVRLTGSAPAELPQALATIAGIVATIVGGRPAGSVPELAALVRHVLLTDRPAEPPGWELAARCWPPPGRTGGSWYDAYPLPTGEVLLSVGDVGAADLVAASRAAQLRDLARHRARAGDAPHQVLARLAAVLGAGPPVRLFVGLLDAGDGVLRWSAAGSAAPAVGHPGGPVRPLSEPPGPPVGAPSAARATHRTQLPPGAGFVVATAAPSRSDADRNLPVAGLSGYVEQWPTDGGDGAVLAAQWLPKQPTGAGRVPADVELSWVYPATPQAPAAVRRDLRGVLDAAGTAEDAVFALLVAVSEAVNNAVEHAQRPSRPEVHVELAVAAGVARVRVRDFGTWRGRQPAMDRGRGAALMSSYADVRVRSEPTGTTVLIERRLTDQLR